MSSFLNKVCYTIAFVCLLWQVKTKMRDVFISITGFHREGYHWKIFMAGPNGIYTH